MVNKIKFSDVPLLKMISSPTNATLYIKLFDLIIYDYINGGIINVLNHWHDGVNHEVELVSKCSNCKFKDDNYCWKLKKDIEEKPHHMGYDTINKNPETFSCSLFEIKNLSEGE